MKKQSSDQAFHDRRHQERKRAEAARNLPKKKLEDNKRAVTQNNDTKSQLASE